MGRNLNERYSPSLCVDGFLGAEGAGRQSLNTVGQQVSYGAVVVEMPGLGWPSTCVVRVKFGHLSTFHS